MQPHFPDELKHLYNEVEFIGSGGFARVFKAKRRDGRIVAVKIPINMDEATGKSFFSEINSWKLFDHKNIVSLYDFNILPIPFLEQEYMKGGSLQSPKKPFDVAKACEIIFEIAEGLKYAHKKGIVHRDIKPQNILLSDDGVAKISDWGMSRFMAESRSLTPHGYTPAYAAPEQISPKLFGETDERTDIYQLGVIFYNLLTNDLHFKGEDLIEIAFAIVNDMHAAPSQFNPEAKEVDHIVLRCLNKKKEERYQSAEELQNDLEKFIEPKQTREKVQEQQQKTKYREKPKEEQKLIPKESEAIKAQKKGKKPSEKYLAIILLIILVAGAGYYTWPPGPPPVMNETQSTGTPSQTPVVSLALRPIPLTITNSVGIEFTLIPAGEFSMGSSPNKAGRGQDKGQVHRVKIAKAFYMSKFEITQKQWYDVMGTNVSYFKGDNLPVEQVSWNEAQEFISRLNEKEAIEKYRLPSEDEWEYAVRAGNSTRDYFGDDASNPGDYGWFSENSQFKTHEVGQKKPNPWGLYDMYGNVWEWLQDLYHNSYDGTPIDGNEEKGNNSNRVIRGGSFDYSIGQLRAANRNERDPGFRHYNTGFRLVMDS